MAAKSPKERDAGDPPTLARRRTSYGQRVLLRPEDALQALMTLLERYLLLLRKPAPLLGKPQAVSME